MHYIFLLLIFLSLHSTSAECSTANPIVIKGKVIDMYREIGVESSIILNSSPSSPIWIQEKFNTDREGNFQITLNIEPESLKGLKFNLVIEPNRRNYNSTVYKHDITLDIYQPLIIRIKYYTDPKWSRRTANEFSTFIKIKYEHTLSLDRGLLFGIHQGRITNGEIGFFLSEKPVDNKNFANTYYILSSEFTYTNKLVVGPKLGVSGQAIIGEIGGYIIPYTDFHNVALCFRPQTGITFGVINLLYGYNIRFTGKEISRDINKHMVSMIIKVNL